MGTQACSIGSSAGGTKPCHSHIHIHTRLHSLQVDRGHARAMRGRAPVHILNTIVLEYSAINRYYILY
jgi:hypothetical protein